ncbi:MAG: sensor histidine kinase, partial [Firmicutes bacterium]|nr:sensor histidine kinase [Bacillota bacterium]
MSTVAPAPPSLRRTLVLRQTILLTLLLVMIGATQFVVLRSVLLHTTAASLRSEVAVLEPIIHHSLTRNRPAGFSALAAILLERLHAPGVEVIIANRYGMLMASSSTVPQGLPPP